MHAEPPFRFFERDAELALVEGCRLPHWLQSGTLSFITWRTWDSMPRPVVEKWLAARNAKLAELGIDPARPDVDGRISELPESVRTELKSLLADRWESCLDECHGECVLRQIDLSEIVSDSLRHFDGDRYRLTDFVVMPNHVHVLAAFADGAQMRAQCESWKHFTAVRINRMLGRKGRFWETENFDHLVRSEVQWLRFRRYIADIPRRAGLKAGTFIHYTADVPGSNADV